MRNRRFPKYIAGAVVGVVGGLLTLSVGASAHSPSDWYRGKWRTGTLSSGVIQDQIVDWRFVDNVPTNGQRAAIDRGADDWNQEGGITHTASMKFNYESTQPDYGQLATNGGFCTAETTDEQSEYQRDKIGWMSFGDDSSTSGEPLADAPTCLLKSSADGTLRLFAFKIRINKDFTFYRGTDSVPDDKYDLWAVAAHEFGHATGFLDRNDGHWPESWDVCPGDDDPITAYRHTMCPSTIRGNKAQRNLAEHDLHTFITGIDAFQATWGRQ